MADLGEYRRKRDARRTPEPVPAEGPLPVGDDDVFVVQEHHATRLHYDVRFERDGVLVSWAVPKGLVMSPGAVRLAVHTEDHPMEYAAFEGDIPKGEYGGGHVSIWDRGTYEAHKWTDYEIDVTFHGTRLDGRYVFIHKEDKDWLVRKRGKAVNTSTTVEVQGRRLKLTNLEKVLYPDGFTKAHVIDYYRQVAPYLLDHLAERPVTLKRFPDGVDAESFFEKNVSRHAPEWLRTMTLPTPGSSRGAETLDFAMIDDLPGLVWAANLAALEFHVPQWTVGPRGGVREPDLLVFDLDPGPGTTLVECARAALDIREILAEDELTGFPKTSGAKGMQLYVPVRVTVAERTSEYAKEVAQRLAREHPDRYVAVMAKARRADRVFIDWSQNNTAKTTVAPYSLRARDLPTVSTPVTWREVERCRKPEDLVFTAPDVVKRLDKHGDLLAELHKEPGRLPTRR
jgi:DNA ligase D-like protein (predicted polymerase)/DNA ligase D-like protein (predicted 3'-phosphoesterase)